MWVAKNSLCALSQDFNLTVINLAIKGQYSETNQSRAEV